jgi:hypothetical protein
VGFDHRRRPAAAPHSPPRDEFFPLPVLPLDPDEADRERLGELGGGMSRKAIARAVAGLDFERHEILVIDGR